MSYVAVRFGYRERDETPRFVDGHRSGVKDASITAFEHRYGIGVEHIAATGIRMRQHQPFLFEARDSGAGAGSVDTKFGSECDEHGRRDLSVEVSEEQSDDGA